MAISILKKPYLFQIYKTLINQEEMRTGQPSLQKKDVTTEEAMMNHATREKYIHRMYLMHLVECF